MMELIIKTKEEEFLKSVDFNFSELKGELTAALEKYKGLAYEESQIKEAKKDRATLNKFRDALDAKRKDIKNKCLAPYNVFEAQIKELTALVDAPISEIDGQIKAVDEKKKAEKRAVLETFFDTQINSECKKYFTFADVFSEKMLNTTVSLQTAKESIIKNVISFENDLKILSDVPEKYRAAALDAYISNKNLSAALQAVKKLESLDAKIEPAKMEIPAPANDIKPETPAKAEPATAETLTACFKVTGTKAQLIALRDFIRANGIKIEPIIGIKEDDLSELIEDSLFLRNLYAAGVDNWQDFEEVKKPNDAEISENTNKYKL